MNLVASAASLRSDWHLVPSWNQDCRVLHAIGSAFQMMHGAMESRIGKPIDDVINSVLIIPSKNRWATERRVAIRVKADDQNSTSMVRQCDQSLC
jgi:hypothetical protein